MTKDDLLSGNVDLLERAGALLAQGTPRRFDLDLSVLGQVLTISLTTQNVQSVDIYVDGRPAKDSTAISNGTTSIEIANPPSGALLQIDGFDSGELVASRKRALG